MTGHEHHGPTYKDYVLVFVALAVLTGLTVGISYSGLGPGTKESVAFVIATVKALLVATLFMHLRYEPRIIVLFAIIPVVLAVFFILAISPDIGIAGP